MQTKKPLVIFHKDCQDGFTSAWAAWRALGDKAEYLPAQYGDKPPDVGFRLVYILDFSYSREELLAMCEASLVVVLDHHKSAVERLVGLEADGLEMTLDVTKCGARLAWEHFHPETPAPWLIDVVEDRDLWLWQQPFSREVNAWLSSLERTFEAWSEIADGLEKPWFEVPYRIGDHEIAGEFHPDGLLESAVEQGTAILRYQRQQVVSAVKNAGEVEIAGYKVLAVNSTTLISEIAGELAANRPFGACFFLRADGSRVWSLRSREGGIDVSEVAKQFGGGGHRGAAGFTIKGTAT